MSRAALSPAFWVLFWGTLINRAASFVGLFLALHLTKDLGISESLAGWIVGAWGAGSLAMSPIAGVLADRLGRKATMLSGLIPSGLIVLAIALSENVPLLFVLVILGGAAQQLYFPASNAAISDLVPSADRTRAYGLIYMSANLGLGIGFAIGGLVPEHHITDLFIADAITTFITAAIILFKVPESRPRDVPQDSALAGLARVVGDRVYMRFAALHLVALLIFTQFQLALPLDMTAHGQSARGFSWLMAFNCLGVAALQPWLAPRLRRYDGSRLLAVSALLFGVGYGFNALVAPISNAIGGGDAWRLALYLFGAAFWTVGEVVGFPVASALVADLAPVSLRGRYQGVFAMLWGGAMFLSPVLGGTGLDVFGGPALWIACVAVGLAVAVGHLAAGPGRRERLARSPS